MAIDFAKLLKKLDIKVRLGETDWTPKITKVNAAPVSDEIKGGLDKIDEKYNIDNQTDNISLPEKVETVPLEYSPMSDEEIKNLAKNSLAEYYTLSSKGLNEQADSSKKDLTDYKNELLKALSQKESNIDTGYDEAKKSTAGEALKRGLARSSIALGQLSEIDKEKAQVLAKTRNDFLEQAAEIDYRINDLETKKQSAINDLNITYAAKIAMEIGDLKTQRQEKIEEVAKYNNELTKYQAQYNIDRQTAEQDLKLGEYDLLEKKTVGMAEIEEKLQAKKYEEKFEYIMDYLSSMSKKDAIKYAENSDIIKNSLDTYNYRKLLNALEARN